jgi:hypothetical protein
LPPELAFIKSALVEPLEGPRAHSMDEDGYDETYQRENATIASSKNDLYESAIQDVILIDDLIATFTDNLI